MSRFTLIDWIVLVVYFASMAAMGPLLAHRGRSTERYFLGGRSYPGWLLGLTMFATSISSITFVAYPADAYKTAYLRFLLCLMLPFGIYLADKIFLPFYRQAKIVSAFEYLEARFGTGTRVYAASAFIVGQIIRISLILYLVSLLVYEMTHLNPYLCVFIGGIVTSFYTVLGGIEAVIWTDFIQSFLLWGGGFVCFGVVLYHIPGGLGTVIREAWADGKFMLGDLNTATGQLEPAPWGFSLTEKTILMMLIVGLSQWLTEYSSNQNVIQKYVAAKSPKDAFQAIWICCLCSVPTWGFFMFLGTSLYVFFKLFPDPNAQAMLTGQMKAEQILPYFVVKFLPTGLSGLVIAGVLAAAMSSLSSSINAISAVSIVDIYKRHIMKDKQDSHYVKAAKIVSLISSILMIIGALFLLVAQSKTLQDTATKLGAIFGGGLLGLYVLGFMTTRGDGRSVGVGIILTIIFSTYISLIELKLINKGLFLGLGLSEKLSAWLAQPIDTYYAGILGHAILFLIAYFLAVVLLPAKPRELHNLTIWTRD
ncbi:MAG: sodium/solute symporter [Candidatus Hydrogenedentes bacterium]|nr:sodium/solute symporter [Candidatus Hydrogenedentota bacterium]